MPHATGDTAAAKIVANLTWTTSGDLQKDVIAFSIHSPPGH